MKVFEKFTLKRLRTPSAKAVQQNILLHDTLPDLSPADSYSISSSSVAGSDRSVCTNASVQQQNGIVIQTRSSRIVKEIQTDLRQSIQIRRKQRSARQQWLGEQSPESQSSEFVMQESVRRDSQQSMSFLPETLQVKRKLVAVREQQVRNLLATERLMLQQVALSKR
jgi:hypothetical protein